MQQVADWLQKLGLGQYAQRFAENDISYSILPHLTDQDLKELGVQSLGHRRQLLLAIAETTGVQKGTTGPASATDAPVAPHDTAERRQVTVMFSDLVGSTALSARMDPEDLVSRDLPTPASPESNTTWPSPIFAFDQRRSSSSSSSSRPTSWVSPLV
jgi:hypothetical protein